MTSAELRKKMENLLDEACNNAERLCAEARALPWYCFSKRQRLADKMRRERRRVEMEMMMFELFDLPARP